MITDNSRSIIRPYTDYINTYSNYYYYNNREEEKKPMNLSDKEIIDIATGLNLVVNPRTQTYSKTVDIEFQMEKK